MSGRIVLVLLAAQALAAGCQSALPERAMRLSPDWLGDRQLQSRRFDDTDEAALLSACAGLLQDLGFTIDESETEVGLIVASRERRADVPVEAMIIRWLGMLFLDVDSPLDERQRVRASVVTAPVGAGGRSFLVRVTFQRIVRDTENEVSRRERLSDPRIYEHFFEQLSKSLFLEAEAI